MSFEEARANVMKMVDSWIESIEGEWSIDLTHERVEFEKALDSLIAVARGESPC